MKLQTEVVYKATLKCFYDTVNKKKLKGITKFLKKAFFPKYNYKKAKLETTAEPKQPKRAEPPGPRGKRRGSLVDQQLSDIVNGVLVPPQKIHPFTKAAFAALAQAGLAPRTAQVVVYDRETKLATACDLVAVRTSSNEPVIVELKCSQDKKYFASCGPMRGAMARSSDSLASQHALQVQLTRHLFEKTYGVRAHAVVLRICDVGTAALKEVPRDEDATRAAYSQLCATVSKKQKARPKFRKKKKSQFKALKK